MHAGVQATPHGGFRDLPKGVRIVLVDVHEHPDSTIGQIAERTGFPQSHVSAAVARLRETGALVTTTDERDRRRTIVRPARRNARVAADAQSAVAVERTITQMLTELHGPDGPEFAPEVLGALDILARHLSPVTDHATEPPSC